MCVLFLKDKISTIHYTNERLNVNNIYPDTIFYRNRSYNRNTDVINMKTITRKMILKNDNNILFNHNDSYHPNKQDMFV